MADRNVQNVSDHVVVRGDIISLAAFDMNFNRLKHTGGFDDKLEWLCEFRRRFPAGASSWYITGTDLEDFRPISAFIWANRAGPGLEQQHDEQSRFSGTYATDRDRSALPTCLRYGTPESLHLVSQVGQEGTLAIRSAKSTTLTNSGFCQLRVNWLRQWYPHPRL